MDSIILLSINKRLEVIVNLLLQQKTKDGMGRTLQEQIQLLHGAGLKPKEIAEILGKSPAHVNKELTGLRKSGKVRSKSETTQTE
jgi:CRP-like cAMP-binding protein